jgi:hypothetical protein
MRKNFKVIEWLQPLGLGITGSRDVTVGGIAKAKHVNAPYSVQNEFVANRIAQFLHLPVSPGYVQEDDAQEIHFISLNFNPNGLSLPPIIPDIVVPLHPEVCAGVLAFDILIGNCDRHAGNLMHDMTTNEMVIFDHGHTLFGIQPGMGIARLHWLSSNLGVGTEADPWNYVGNLHCLLKHIKKPEYLLEWVEKIKQIPDFFIDDLCRDLLKLDISLDEANALKDFLKTRRSQIGKLFNKHQALFEGIVQWTLFQ